jgi:hypothetical protein
LSSSFFGFYSLFSRKTIPQLRIHSLTAFKRLRVFVEKQCLENTGIPAWLADTGISIAKIPGFNLKRARNGFSTETRGRFPGRRSPFIGEPDQELRPGPPADLDDSTQLVGSRHADQAQSQRIGVFEVDKFRLSDAVVAYGQSVISPDCLVDIQTAGLPFHPSGNAYFKALETNTWMISPHGTAMSTPIEMVSAGKRKSIPILSVPYFTFSVSTSFRYTAEIIAAKAFRIVQHFMRLGHGVNPVPAFIEHAEHARIHDLPRLEVQEACNDLQVVFDTVVDLLEQQLLLAIIGLDLFLGPFQGAQMPDGNGEKAEYLLALHGDGLLMDQVVGPDETDGFSPFHNPAITWFPQPTTSALSLCNFSWSKNNGFPAFEHGLDRPVVRGKTQVSFILQAPVHIRAERTDDASPIVGEEPDAGPVEADVPDRILHGAPTQVVHMLGLGQFIDGREKAGQTP